jgi:hypothetical protein
MWPYYNGGIIFMPWDCELPRLWTDYGHRIAKLFQNKPEKVRSRVKSDMVSLAIAIERLKQQGACFKPLPDHLHGHWMHLQGGLLSLEKIKLFHATNMFQPAYNTLEATRQFLCFGPGWIYQNLRWELDKRANRQCYRWKERRQNLLQVISSIVKLAYLRQKLYNKYIRAALDNGYR